MHYFTKILLVFFSVFSSYVFAELSNKDDVEYWQLFDTNNLSLQEVVGTPNSIWSEIPDGQTRITALEDSFWKAARGATMWVKIKLPRIVDTDKIWIELAPNVGLNGKMAVYDSRIWSWVQPAGRQSSNDSEFPATFLTFALENPRDHRLVFLKVNSSQVLNFSINIRDHDSQISLLASRNLIYGICFGLMLLAIVYNMAIGISATERVYIYYASYVIGMSLYMMSMTGYNRLAFPEWGGDGSFSNLAACLGMFAATIFVRELLQTKTTIPKLDVLLKLQSAALFGTIFLLGFISDSLAFILVESIGIVIPIITLACALGALKKKHPMAKFFLLTWLTHLTTGSLWVWMWLGFTPATIEVLNIFVAGSVTELLMLSILLGYNYANLKQRSIHLTEDGKQADTGTEYDHLTGIYSRQGLYSQIERTLKTNEKDLVWIDINIDNFSQFNEKNGVHMGDMLLSEFGQLLQTKVRRDNLAAKLIDKENSYAYRRGLAGRIGGGQFTVVLSNCSLPQARLYVERLVRDFENIKVKTHEGKWLGTTICVGAVNILPNEKFHTAWQRASKKLSSAKSKGKSQIAFA